MPDDTPEKVGRYEIIRAIGKGAMGVVYEGRDPMIGRRVAIKMCRADVLESSGLRSEILKRFERELRAAGALQHPNIITIYDVGEVNDAPYIAMEYVEGNDLRHVIERRSEYTLPEMIELCAKVCEALHEAHRHGVIHRDVKPANILLPASGGVKVADFGIARVPNSELTIDGAIVGTPHYMSPEQFTGATLDGRSDLFSVGIILYELLTGEKPFAGEALSTVMHHVLKRDPVPPSELNASLPPSLDQVLRKALAKRPNDRYADGNTMAAALREAISAEPRPDVLVGAPRRAQTLIGATRPPAPETEPPMPEVKDEDSTVRRRGVPDLDDDHSSSMLLPAIGVGLFAALIVIAIALRVQAPRQSGAPAPAANAAATEATQPPAMKDAIFLAVWAADTQELFDKIAAAKSTDEITAIRRELPQAAAVQVRAIGAQAVLTDTQPGGDFVLTASVNPFGKPLAVPAEVKELAVIVTSAGYQDKKFTLARSEDGSWPVHPVVLMKAPEVASP